jgi:serine protease Do
MGTPAAADALMGLERGVGSGIVLAPDGLIVTNAHVIDHASDIRVVLADRREFPARVVGQDRPTDLAVLHIDARGLAALPLGDSSRVRVGESVVAFGNAFGMGQAVSRGIVSAKARGNVGIADFEEFLQTDAAINPGSSGGPLVNLKGEIVGITTAIASRSGGFQGVGFAIPSNMVREVTGLVLRDGRVLRGQLGLLGQDMTPQLARAMEGAPSRGVLVSETTPCGGADVAGLAPGDILLSLEGQEVASVSDLRNRVGLRGANSEVRLEIWRDGATFTTQVELDRAEAPTEDPEEEGAPPVIPAESSTSGLEGVMVIPAEADLLHELGLPAEAKGVIVSSVFAGSAHAGLLPGDLITEVSRRPIESPSQMAKAIRSAREVVLLTIRRREGSTYLAIPK